MNWYGRVSNDINQIPNFIQHYETELVQARLEVKIRGNLETNLKEMPAFTEIRFTQLQDIEAVLKYLELELRKIRKEKYVEYERYQKALTGREVEKYIDGEKDVVDFEVLILDVANIRNQYQSIMKALESKNYMMGHITRLRVVGMEDIEL